MKKDFREISLDDFSHETFIYCDPPYLITNATYNENGMWTEIEEKTLLEFWMKPMKKVLALLCLMFWKVKIKKWHFI